MGVKGKLAWALKTDRVSEPSFQAIYREFVNLLLETCESVDEINRRLKEVGFHVGGRILP